MIRLFKLVLLTILGIALIVISQAGIAQIARAALEPERQITDFQSASQTGLVTGTVQDDVEARADDEKILYYFPLIFKSFDPSQPWRRLNVTKTASPTPAEAGALLTYTIRTYVSGTEPVPGLILVDPIPLQTEYVSCAGGLTCSLASEQVSWNLGDVTPYASRLVTVVVRIDRTTISGTMLHNVATVTDTTGLTASTELSTPVWVVGRVRYVAIDGTDPGNNCAISLYPCATVQHAVDVAMPGDEIRVAAGDYRGVSHRSGVTQTVYLDKNLAIRGGYTTTNWSTADPYQHVTRLDAAGRGRVFYISGVEGASIEGLSITGGDASGLAGPLWVGGGAGGGLYIATGTVTISHCNVYSNFAPVGGGGLWLENGTASLFGNQVSTNTGLLVGGGLALYQSNAAVNGNTFETNSSGVGGGAWLDQSISALSKNYFVANDSGTGGGLTVWNSDITLNQNSFTANAARGDQTSGAGGGLNLSYSIAALNDNIITGNTADINGGGIYLTNSELTLAGNNFSHNHAHDGGGLFALSPNTITASGNIIVQNLADFGGGGVLASYFLFDPDVMTFTNNIIADNQAAISCPGLYINNSVAALLHNTIARNRGGDGTGVCVWDSTVTMKNTIVVSHTTGIAVGSGSANLEATLWGSDGWANETDWSGPGPITTGTVNIWGDPYFVDPDGGDYHLAISTSAAINVGVNAGVWTDIDDEARPEGRGFDLGADEYYTTCPPDCIVAFPYIIIQDPFGDMAGATGTPITVYVEDHLPDQDYELCFEDVTSNFAADCILFHTDNLGTAVVTYVIPVAAPRSEPPGTKTYRFYTQIPNLNPVATCALHNAPCFEVTGSSARINASNIGNKEQEPPVRWPISSSIPIYLYGHDPNANYFLTLNGLPSGSAPGTLQFQGAEVDQIPTNSQGTNVDNDPAYYIATGHLTGPLTIASQDPSGPQIVETTVELTEAAIDIAGETPGATHPQDDILTIVVRGLAPKQDYSLIFEDGVTLAVPRTADVEGDLLLYYVIMPGILKPDGLPYQPGDPPMPVDILVFDRNRGNNPNAIARRTFWVFTPEEPYQNVPGGSNWPANSSITIQGRQHVAEHFYQLRLEQGEPGSPTFSDTVTNSIEAIGSHLGGEFDLSYTIPATFTAGTYQLRSYDVSTPTKVVAELLLAISPKPAISIEGGQRWIPGTTINIYLTDHAAHTPYELWLDPDNVYGQRTQIVDTLGRSLFLTDGDGRATISYYVPVTMPEQIKPGYVLHSFFADNLNNAVADNGQLEIQKAELMVSRIELPEIIFDVPLPITLTVTNHNPVTVTNTYLDLDLYLDPPAPPNQSSSVPPGEYKQWIDYIPPSGTVTIQEEVVFFGRYGRQLYGRVDTSNRVVESLESNNLSIRSIPSSCPVELFDSFEGHDLAGWSQTPFGDGITGTQIESGGTLILSNSGSNALAAADNGPAAGYHLMHQTVGSGPFEAIIRLDQPPANGAVGRAGLEIRADTGDTAAKLIFALRGDGQLQLFSRPAGLPAVEEQSQSLKEALPVWLRLNRRGSDYIFSYTTWPGDVPPRHWRYFTTVGSPGLPDTVEVGLMNAPGSSTTPYEAEFSHFFVCATTAPGGTPGGDSLYLGQQCGPVEERGHGLAVIDAANTITNEVGDSHSWTPVGASSALGEPLLTGLEMSPDSGADLADQSGPHAAYQVEFESSGAFYIWVAGWGPDEAGNGVHVGLNGAPVGLVDGLPTGGNLPGWVKMAGSVEVEAGLNTLDLWGKEDGARVFKLLLTNNPTFSPPAAGMAQSPCAIIVEPYLPPLWQQCLDPLRQGDFEGTFDEVTDEWHPNGEAIVYSVVSYQGNRGAGFPNFDGYAPSINQTIGLPGWLLSNTTAILRLWKGVDRNFNGSSAATDQLYFTLRWASEPAPPAPGFDLIEPILLAAGLDTSVPDLDSLNPSPDDWTEFSQDILGGLEALAVLEPDTPVRAYFYTPNPGQGTAFYLDDISLTFCTTQPEPAIQPGTGRLSGKILRFSQPAAGVPVWAYAVADSDGYDPGPVFKTFSLPDGSYRFYNLPPGQYLIYATITDPNGTFFDSALRNVNPDDNVMNVILTIETS